MRRCATKTAQTFVCAVFVVCQKQARIGCTEGASCSGTQCLAPQAQNSLGRAPSVCAVFVVCQKQARVGRAEGASYSGTQCLAPQAQNSLGRAPPVRAAFVMCQKQARIGCAEGVSYSGTKCLAPQAQNSLRARTSRPCRFCNVSEAGSDWLRRRRELFGHEVPCAAGGKTP